MPLYELTIPEALTIDFLNKHEWVWLGNPQIPNLYELWDTKTDRMLAWIDRRPGYCDRGHWRAGIECVPSLDEHDEFPRYFMRLRTAKQEIVEFLSWRLFKQNLVRDEE